MGADRRQDYSENPNHLHLYIPAFGRGWCQWHNQLDLGGKHETRICCQSSSSMAEGWHRCVCLGWCPSHRGNDVKALGAMLVIQPPYSPELNPAERVFEAIRAEVEGKIYATIADKQEAVENFLKELSAAPERIKKLAGWAWIQETISSIANSAT